jgi:hypothetical protein
MRKRYNESGNNKIIKYFTEMIAVRYLLPSIAVLVFVFMLIFLGFSYLSHVIQAYSTFGFLYLVCINVLVTISTISIFHTIRTCIYGYKQISNRKYTVLQLTCVSKTKRVSSSYCTLSDGKKYKLYDMQYYYAINENEPCDLIIVTNAYGAKLWEMVVPSIQ